MLFTFFFFIIKKIGPFQEVSETVFSGFNSMMFALALLMMSYVLKNINDKMGLTTYVINSVKPIITKELLPVVVFIALSFIAYTTGSSWGMYAIALPIVIPLANQFHSEYSTQYRGSHQRGHPGRQRLPLFRCHSADRSKYRHQQFTAFHQPTALCFAVFCHFLFYILGVGSILSFSCE